LKNWKKRLGVLLLTIAYVCFAAWTIVAYNQWASATIQRASHGHPELIPYIDVAPYLATIYGKAAIAGAVVVGIIDIVALALILRSKAKTATVASLSIILARACNH
jgi:hypothetical protein